MITLEWIELGLSRQYFIRINNAVGVALLSQETLAVLGKILIDGVSCNYGLETCAAAICFRPEDSAQSLRLFLSRAEGAGDLDCD